mgnify:CR=1 FL=1
MIRLAASALALSLVAGTALAEPVAYDFDKSHANLAFSYNHLGYSTTEGRFGEWEGTLLIDKDTPANSSIEFTIDVGSLDTFWAERNAHFLSADFFDAEKFPKATFKSTKVEKTGDNQLEVPGDLTIKGIGRQIVLPFAWIIDGDQATMQGEVTLNRTDFKVGEGDWAKGKTVGLQVDVKVRLALKRS